LYYTGTILIKKKIGEMKMSEEQENNIIEITDDDGLTLKCELYDIIEFEGKQYAILVDLDSSEEDPELVIMEYYEENGESYFETIEDDEEFEKVSKYIESLDDVEEE
jgi:uncharacterized protein YrzB (UPF0473 family)